MQLKTRTQKAKFNTLTSLIYQLVTVGCGLITPRLFISAFGSESYGATTSIIQFLSYVTLIEGGIGGVARAAFYKPLAEKDIDKISSIYYAIKKFFNLVGIVFLVYTTVIAFSYYKISNISVWEPSFTILMVFAISISTMGQYFFGITNLTLLNADQKQYINNVLSILTTLVNTILIVFLIFFDCNILIVKFCSSCVFIVRPLFFMIYVKKHYDLTKVRRVDSNVLNQKWTGIGQHIAFFLHTNTDIVMLTCLADLTSVAIYSVYNMVNVSIRGIARAFSVGMEAVFGDMIAKNQKDELSNAYRYFENLLFTISVVLFSSAAILVVSFVRIYVGGVSDVNYIQPMFGYILLFSEAIDSMMIPCYSLPIAANHFKQTRLGAYGEAFFNIVISAVLIWWNPLIGVAIGTLIAVVYKAIYYMVYSSRYIIRLNFRQLICNLVRNCVLMLGMVTLGNHIVEKIEILYFYQWLIVAIVVFICVTIVTVIFNLMVLKKEYKKFIISVFNKRDIFS